MTIPVDVIQYQPGLLSTWGAVYAIQGNLQEGIDLLTKAYGLAHADKELFY